MLGQLVSCDCSLQNSKNDFPDNVSMACAPVSGTPLLTWQLAVTSGVSEAAKVFLVLWMSVLLVALTSFQPTPGSECSAFL